MLEISKEFQDFIEARVLIRFCINVNGHEISGKYTNEDIPAFNCSSVEFDDPKLMYESFTPEEVDEIQEWIENNSIQMMRDILRHMIPKITMEKYNGLKI
jgi:hypothetical protein